MDNLTLKHGDLVKSKINDDLLGFGKGRLYMVTESKRGLGIYSDKGVRVLLVDDKGELLEACDNVSKHICPVVLPRGVSQ